MVSCEQDHVIKSQERLPTGCLDLRSLFLLPMFVCASTLIYRPPPKGHGFRPRARLCRPLSMRSIHACPLPNPFWVRRACSWYVLQLTQATLGIQAATIDGSWYQRYHYSIYKVPGHYLCLLRTGNTCLWMTTKISMSLVLIGTTKYNVFDTWYQVGSNSLQVTIKTNLFGRA